MDNAEVIFPVLLVEFAKSLEEKREKAVPWRAIEVNKSISNYQPQKRQRWRKEVDNFNIKGRRSKYSRCMCVIINSGFLD